MTRPKVDPDKRRRTAQACDSCKRRKQKCNGLEPCTTCTKRSLPCTYGVASPKEEDPSPSKRQKTDHQSNSSNSSPRDVIKSSPRDHESEARELPLQPEQEYASHPSQWTPTSNQEPRRKERPRSIDLSQIQKQRLNPLPSFQNGRYADSTAISKSHAVQNPGPVLATPDEEATLYNSARMLQDPSGRLLYVGDAATLSFLQLMRMIVDNVVGPTPFTSDPRRHRIVEGASSLPATFRQTHLLPNRQTAQVLVEAFFTNTNGLVEVFDRQSFFTTLASCYGDPLSVDPSWLCLLYLTFAIGLVMASPRPGSQEHAIILKLRADQYDRAEVFYQDAKNLSDPTTGFEDAGFWSIQALTLMSVYTLAVSKRNAAYAYHGMAIRSAFALGLHREETMVIFSSAEQLVRRNLWRSLFVLDRFLSAMLGRPTAIQESDCSGTTLTCAEMAPYPANHAYDDFIDSVGLEASVRSCHDIGAILDKVYSQRKISTKLAQELANSCKNWSALLDRRLHWMQAKRASPNQGIAILHVNLMHCHSIVLLCRPFFLFLLNKRFQQLREGHRSQKFSSKMEKFAEACVIASTHTVALAQNALESKYLPQRNPFVMYFLFASALVVLSNEFATLYHNPDAMTSIDNAIGIMQYCADQDPQASRLLFILTSFRDVVVQQQADNPLRKPVIAQSHFKNIEGEVADPMANIFTYMVPASPQNPSIFTHTMPASPQISSILKHPFIINSSSDLSKYPTNNMHSPESHHLNRDNSSSSSRPSHSQNNVESSPETYYDIARAPPQSNMNINNHHSHPQSHHHSGNASTDSESHNSANDAEIDFEMLWQWPGSNGAAMTPGAIPGQIGWTPGGSIGVIGHGMAVSHADIQGVSDSSIPLYGMAHGGGGV